MGTHLLFLILLAFVVPFFTVMYVISPDPMTCKRGSVENLFTACVVETNNNGIR